MNLRNERLNCYEFNKTGAISFINSAGTQMFIYHDNFKHSKIQYLPIYPINMNTVNINIKITSFNTFSTVLFTS